MKPDMEKIMQVLISLIEEQEHVKIDYTLEKRTEEETAQAVEGRTSYEKANSKQDREIYPDTGIHRKVWLVF